MEEEENEDETLYCFCQKQSYGDVSCWFQIGEGILFSSYVLFPTDDCLR